MPIVPRRPSPFSLRSSLLAPLPSLLALLTLAGCGGGFGGENSYVTGLTVSPKAIVAPGTEVVLTATVKDAAQLRSAQWSADGGTLSVSTGLVARWIAPAASAVTEPIGYNLTLTVMQNNGLTDVERTRILVDPSSNPASGARITGTTATPTEVNAGGIVNASVTTANTADTVSVSWTADMGTLVTSQGYNVQWQAPSNVTTNQIATLTVTTVDRLGDTFSAPVRVTVKPPPPLPTGTQNPL